MSTAPEHHKYLPAHFARGYITAYIHVFGYGVMQAYYGAAASAIKPEIQECENFLEPLTPHISLERKIKTLLPLDYVFVALFYQGMLRNYGSPDNRRLKNDMRQVGVFWCLGEAPIVNGFEQLSIVDHIIPTITVFSKLKRAHTVPGYVKLAALKVLIQTFIEASGITSQLSKGANELIFEIEDCPFCANHRPPCLFFEGIIEGFIRWFDTHLPATADHSQLALDTTRSTGHHVVVSLLYH
jgi:hypothetical protein